MTSMADDVLGADLDAAEAPLDGAALLDALRDWFGTYIRVTDPDDLAVLALWTAHTHLTAELYTTPRLQIDSTIYGSGKSTVLDHLARLCLNALHAATLSSPALIPRILENGPATLLLDEIDRSLDPNRPGVPELLGILNSGYRVGATRPVLVPVKGGGWDVVNMPTHAAVAMAGNSPRLPADTMSRNIRILLMPDLDGTVAESDWELIAQDVERLHDRLGDWAGEVRDSIRGSAVDLPPGCVGRSKEKWRPLKRVAVAAGGAWPQTADRLIARSVAEDAAEREAGLKTLPPGMVLLADLHAVWPPDEPFMATRELVAALIAHNGDYWGSGSPFGRQLTESRFGKLLAQATKLTSVRPERTGPRGFTRAHLLPVWQRLGLARIGAGTPGAPGAPGTQTALTCDDEHPRRVRRLDPATAQPGAPGANAVTCDDDRPRQVRRVLRLETDPPADAAEPELGDWSTPEPTPPGHCWCGYPPPAGRSEHFDCESKRLAAEAQT